MKKSIFILFFMSILMAISSYSWITIWMSMEINFLSFIFIMNNKMNFKEMMIKYFIIQSCGSIIFLFSVTKNSVFFNQEFNNYSMAPPIALMLKSGMAPFHFWVSPIVSKFNFNSMFLFLTFQKMIPMFILFSSWYLIIIPIAMINIMIGSISGINQSSMTNLLIFSSINNIGWMLFSNMESMLTFMTFFTCYIIMNFVILNLIFPQKIKWIIQMKTSSFMQKIIIWSSLLSLSGLPPFMGFFTKWMILSKMIHFTSMAYIAILFSLFTLFFYIKACSSFLMKSWSIPKYTMNFNPKNKWIFILFNMSGAIIWYLLT